MLATQTPFSQYFTKGGDPLDGGKLYFGVANQNPETNPITVYWDSAGSIPAAQPVRTTNGYVARTGAIANVYAPGDYSLTVRDKKGVLVFYAPSSLQFSNDLVIQSQVSEITTDLAAVGGAAMIGWSHGGAGAIQRAIQDVLRDLAVSALNYPSVQQAIDAVNAAGGGAVYLPRSNGASGVYDIGTTGLVMYQNVEIRGAVSRYANTTTRGVRIKYSGSGWAIYGQNLLNAAIRDVCIDCTDATGTSVVGAYWKGAWLCQMERVTIKGATPAKGYGILIDTNPGGPTWGAQHNTIKDSECADGVVRFAGTGPSDGVTTTVVETFRGMQYDVLSSQVVFINATAEGWTTGAGFTFAGNAVCTMIGCDIEGTGPVGISVDLTAKVREFGTIWNGFSGATRVAGNLDTLRTYGGALEFVGTLVANTPIPIATHGDRNVGDYISEELVPTNVTGGSQAGYRRWSRRIAGALKLTHEWREDAMLLHTKATSATSAVTVLTIPVPAAEGLRVEVHAHGAQAGDGPYSNSRAANVINNSGTLTITAEAQVTAGAACAISFVASGANLLVQWTPTTVNNSTAGFRFNVSGPMADYTKG